MGVGTSWVINTKLHPVIIIKHVDKRVTGKDSATGQLIHSHVFVLYSHSWSLVVTCVLLDTILTIWFSLDHKLYASDYDSDYVASENQPLEQSLESLSAVYAASLHFPPLLTRYLFSACAIQPDLRVIRSCSQQKSLNFSGRARDTGKLKKQGNF